MAKLHPHHTYTYSYTTGSVLVYYVTLVTCLLPSLLSHVYYRHSCHTVTLVIHMQTDLWTVVIPEPSPETAGYWITSPVQTHVPLQTQLWDTMSYLKCGYCLFQVALFEMHPVWSLSPQRAPLKWWDQQTERLPTPSHNTPETVALNKEAEFLFLYLASTHTSPTDMMLSDGTDRVVYYPTPEVDG